MGPVPLWSTTALFRCTDCGRTIRILPSYAIALQLGAVGITALLVALAPFMWHFFALIAAIPAAIAFFAIRARQRNPPVTPEVAELLKKALTDPALIAILSDPDARQALHPQSLKQRHTPGVKKPARPERTRARGARGDHPKRPKSPS